MICDKPFAIYFKLYLEGKSTDEMEVNDETIMADRLDVDETITVDSLDESLWFRGECYVALFNILDIQKKKLMFAIVFLTLQILSKSITLMGK